MRKLSDRTKTILEILCIIFIPLILYARTFHYDFVWDDDLLIQNNPYLSQVIHWRDVLNSGLWKNALSAVYQSSYYYRPMVNLFFVLEYKLWGVSPAGFHAVNILLHLAAVFLVWLLGLKLNLDRMARSAAALFFSIHPVQVACVAFISCHGDLLALVFSLLALLFWLKHTKARWFSLIWIFLAMMSKEAAIVLPVVIVLFDRLVCEKPWKDIKKFIPMLLWIPYFMLRLGGTDASSAPQLSWDVFLRNEGGYRMMLYIGRILFPVPTSQAIQALHTSGLWSLVMTVIFLIIIWLLWRRSDKRQKFLILWFLLGTLIIADWINIGLRFSDQLLYIPMASVSLLFATILPTHRLRVYVLIPLFTIFAWLSLQQLPAWKDDMVFWENELEYDSNNVRANLNYTGELMKVGREDEACEKMSWLFKNGSKLYESEQRTLTLNFGKCFFPDRPGVAENYYKHAMKAYPDMPLLRRLLINALTLQNKNKEAVEQAKTLVEQQPDIAISWFMYGDVLFRNNQYEASLEALQRAAALKPDDPQTRQLIPEVQEQLKRAHSGQ